MTEPRPSEDGSRLDRWLDGLARRRDGFAGVPAPAYLTLGVAGIAVGAALFLGLSLVAGASTAVATVLIVQAVAVFVIVSLIRKAIAGREIHVLLQDVALVLGATFATTWALGEAPLAWLDRAAPTLGVFLVFGRMGCLVGGCCHGRAAAAGIRYDDPAAVAQPLLGVRLFPVQLVEGIWTLVVTLAALAAVFAGAAPGTSLSIWLIAYAAGRFVLEFARGDVGRGRLGSLSEAQWWALALLAGRIAWEEAAAGEWRVPRLAALGGAAALAALAWTLRGRLLDLPRPTLTAAEVPAWETFASTLVAHASSAVDEITHLGPIEGVVVVLRVDPSGDARLHSYSIGGTRDPRAKVAVAGFLLQRLARHEVLRAGVCDRGNFHLWTLVWDAERPGSTSDDDPRLVLFRAQDFARRIATLRTEPMSPPAGPPSAEHLPPPEPGAPARPGAGPQPSEPRPDWQPRLRV